MMQRLFSQIFYLVKTDRRQDFVFKSVQYFFDFLYQNFEFELLGGLNVSSKCTDNI